MPPERELPELTCLGERGFNLICIVAAEHQ